MASSQYAIYDRPKQEWTINIIGKQVSKNNPQDTMVFTDSIENIVNDTNIGQIHFIVNKASRKIAPIVSIHKKLLLNNGKLILNSEFLQHIETHKEDYYHKNNWFSFEEFFIIKNKLRWIKKIIIKIDGNQEINLITILGRILIKLALILIIHLILQWKN